MSCFAYRSTETRSLYPPTPEFHLKASHLSAECLHMLCASHMRAAGQKQGRSCSRRPSLHAAAVSEDLWSACLSPNLRTIKTRSPLHRFPFAFNWIDCVLITSCNSEFKIKPSTSSCVRGGEISPRCRNRCQWRLVG